MVLISENQKGGLASLVSYPESYSCEQMCVCVCACLWIFTIWWLFLQQQREQPLFLQQQREQPFGCPFEPLLICR